MFNGTTLNIEFNIIIPPGSVVGLLFVIAIIIGGLLLYVKKKHKIKDFGAELWTRIVQARYALSGMKVVEKPAVKRRKKSKS
jgi:hypothetical protein